MISCLSGRPDFLWTPSAVSYWPSQSIFMAVRPQSSPGVWPSKPEPQHSAPTLCSRHANKHFRLGSAGPALISVVNSLHFVFPAPVACCIPLWSSKAPPTLPTEVSEWVETSLLQCSLLRWKFLFQCLFFSFSFSYIFALPHSVEFSLPFRKSGTFCQHLRCSIGVVPHADVFLTYLWGEGDFHFYSAAILNVLWWGVLQRNSRVGLLIRIRGVCIVFLDLASSVLLLIFSRLSERALLWNEEC